ncbi:hypothetical protein E2562_020587 [Oryza meyeriana var. granulata]|uniref:Uncharacterized protein n=1 Tax=Oryza meyeriana var. granulata TaxID=110450 RepID=A0A6G1DYH9_9ORYZ|nr:hypothetical protein E2562_020587 [Oryza meyeriana var. granulata]
MATVVVWRQVAIDAWRGNGGCLAPSAAKMAATARKPSGVVVEGVAMASTPMSTTTRCASTGALAFLLVHTADRWTLGSAIVLLWMRRGEASKDDDGVTGVRSMGGLLARVVARPA